MAQHGLQLHVVADYVAAVFSLFACILCAIQIHHHIYHNHHPDTRKYIIRILLMVVVYCIESLWGLLDPAVSLYLDTLRDSYEALVIYSFYSLLITSLGGFQSVEHALYLIPMRTMPHVFPFNHCCREWSFSKGRGGSDSFLRNCTIGVLQYCFVQPAMAITTFFLQLSHCHCYGDGEFSYKLGYPYIAAVRSLSQSWAIYCLILFYLALSKQPPESEGHQLFHRVRPIPKFLCIKGVVFFTYWQSVALAGLVYVDAIRPTESWTTDSIASGTQDILICIEMFAAAIAHCYAFKVDDFTESGYEPLVAPHRVIFDVANVTDVVFDASNVLRANKTKSESMDEASRSFSFDAADDSRTPSADDAQKEDNRLLSHEALSNAHRPNIRQRGIANTASNKNSTNSTPSALESQLNDDDAL